MAVKSFELVDYEVRDRIAWLEINNAERMNALSTGVQNGLWLAFDEAINDDDVLVVVLTGRGGRAFCAGADLKETAERDRTVGQGSPQQARSGLSKANGLPESLSSQPSTGMRWRAECSYRRAATFDLPRRSPASGCRSRSEASRPSTPWTPWRWVSSPWEKPCGLYYPVTTSPPNGRTR